jgi:SM-20-related protein
VNQTAVEIVPKWGTLLAFRRSDRSWHGHLPAEGERRVVQVNWVTSQQMADKELRRHRRSAWLKRLLRPSTRSGRPEPGTKGSIDGRRPA